MRHGKTNRRRLPSVLTVKTACQSSLTATFTVKIVRMCMGKKKQRLCEFALLLLIWWKSPSLCPCALSRKTFSAALNGSDKPTSQSMNPTVRPLQTEAQTKGLCGLIVIAQDNRLRRALRVGEPNRMEAPRTERQLTLQHVERRLSLVSVGSLSWPDFSCHESA